ncbi:hypothetical protein GYN67_04105 [Lactococcus piscium]|uniref:hypothetical protein n=1 Tax=Pseudolactococcus carnosus TaxID=2749961 RepID=UPI001FBBD4BB|nr:hypothetical protein [Lactococcus carnosus]MCJ1995877.1 hypothetical protein [Lactococcus carnosus]
MQKLVIDKPDFKYEDYINTLLMLDNNDPEIHMIYGLKFMTPFIGVLIASYLNSQKFKVTSEISPEGEKSSNYAEFINFFHFVENSKNVDERNTTYSGTCTPIMKSIMVDYYRGQENISEKISRKISKVISCDNSDVESVFFYIISELIRNIPEHSHSFDAWHSSQYWVHEEYIESEIALVDYGIGYRESFNFKEDRQLVNDVEAMEFALQPGVTSGITKRSHLRENEEEEYLNSGYGLYMITELCKKFKGKYVIISKSAIATNKKISFLDNGGSFPGTAIKIRLQVPKNLTKEKFQKTISDIAKEGEELSKSISGAFNIASTKSKSLRLE